MWDGFRIERSGDGHDDEVRVFRRTPPLLPRHVEAQMVAADTLHLDVERATALAILEVTADPVPLVVGDALPPLTLEQRAGDVNGSAIDDLVLLALSWRPRTTARRATSVIVPDGRASRVRQGGRPREAVRDGKG
jgi:hypothetical protein